MLLPRMRGVIGRRILANYRVEPEALQRVLPPPFRPQLVSGYGIAGICMIRLEAVRPHFLPPMLGVGSENAAHRIAVEWDTDAGVQQGVYIARRDTSSRLNTLVGGWLFPGEQHHACFRSEESDQSLEVDFISDDRSAYACVLGRPSTMWTAASVFPSLAAASDFFARGSLGYSLTRDPQRFDGIELRCQHWEVAPLDVQRFESSFFDDRRLFPHGALHFDCALLMRNIDHEWHGRPPLCA